jgi:hypothetical protein
MNPSNHKFLAKLIKTTQSMTKTYAFQGARLDPQWPGYMYEYFLIKFHHFIHLRMDQLK